MCRSKSWKWTPSAGAPGDVQIKSGVQVAVDADKHKHVDANMEEPSKEYPETPPHTILATFP